MSETDMNTCAAPECQNETPFTWCQAVHQPRDHEGDRIPHVGQEAA